MSRELGCWMTVLVLGLTKSYEGNPEHVWIYLFLLTDPCCFQTFHKYNRVFFKFQIIISTTNSINETLNVTFLKDTKPRQAIIKTKGHRGATVKSLLLKQSMLTEKDSYTHTFLQATHLLT